MMKNRIGAGLMWLFLIMADQMVKLWALSRLRESDPIVFIPGVLELQYVENRGAAFGIFQNARWFFIIVSLIVLAGLVVVAKKIPRDRIYLPLKLCLFFIGAGAVGNMIDRIFRTYVVDFIYFKLIDFPVFNLADIYVTCAAFLLVFLVVFYYRDEQLERIFPPERRKEKTDE